MLGTFIGRAGAIILYSAPALACSAPLALTCSETVYDERGFNPYDVTHVFLFEPPIYFSGARLRFEDRKLDMKVTAASDATIEATANDLQAMPVPTKVDACLTENSEKGLPGRENIFAILDCQYQAGRSENVVPVVIEVKINRISGDLQITRSQDKDTAHSTTSHGTCKLSPPKF
jgi:hypothetical protein